MSGNRNIKQDKKIDQAKNENQKNGGFFFVEKEKAHILRLFPRRWNLLPVGGGSPGQCFPDIVIRVI